MMLISWQRFLRGRKTKEVLKSNDLLVNESKTEEVVIKMGSSDEERWKEFVKLGSRLGAEICPQQS